MFFTEDSTGYKHPTCFNDRPGRTYMSQIRWDCELNVLNKFNTFSSPSQPILNKITWYEI